MKFIALLAIACFVCSATCQINLSLQKNLRELTIRGIINDKADNFGIDFYSESDKSKIPLHVNPRFNPRWGGEVPYVVLNSHNGGWANELRKGTSLKPGSEFKLRIFINDFNYDIYINDEFFNSMPWRIDHKLAEFIRIHGDVKVSAVHRTFYFSSVENTIPVQIPLDSSTEVRIKGRVADSASVMVYDLENKNSNIPFHASFRFGYQGEWIVVLNNMINGNWQAEQRVPLPVARGQTFSHKIVSDSNGFTLSGDDFSHAFARPASTSTLNVHGNHVTLSKITLTRRY